MVSYRKHKGVFPTKPCQNKTVILTGAGAGMGQEAAFLFASEGANVVVNSLSASAQKTCQEIRRSGGSAIFVQGDVGREADCQRIIQAAVETFGQIDILVNAAGVVPGGSVETASLEDWDAAMDTNVKGVFLMCRLAMPHLRQTKGSIVNIASTVAIKGVANRAIYSATKGAVLSLSRSMAAEYVSEGIRVNCVSPGTVYSPSFQRRVDASPDPELAMRQFIARQPMGRLGTAQEVAKAIVFAAGAEVGFMTGANIVVDGGMTV